MSMRTAAGIAALGFVLLSGSALAAPDQVAQTAAVPKAQPAAPGLPVVDPSVNPCDNFFLHACGPWIKENPIPADQSRWGNFGALAERNRDILRQILEEAAKNPTPETRKIGDFYGTCMDEKAVEAAGIAPLKAHFDRINAVGNRADLTKLVADLHSMGVGTLFSFYRQQSFSNAIQTIASADQGGLGLPDRDFYFKDDEKSKQQREAYVAHITKMFTLAGDTEAAAAKKAEAIMGFETKLAEGSRNRLERRDPLKRNNPFTLADFQKLAPSVDWATYIKAMGAPSVKDLNVGNPDFFKTLEKVLAEAPTDTVKAYLSWHVLRASAPWLPDAFVQENFNFYGKTLSGTKEIQPRWKRCVAATDTALGEDLGKHFVERAFGPEHKKRMLTMVGDVQAAFAEMIPQLDWMSKETQAKALEKLKNQPNKIGYPEQWRDYSKLEVKQGDLLGNAMRAAVFETRYDMNKIGKPRDDKEWGMTPPTVNAYYSPQQNNINFPAGILQPPFFDFRADDAYNYGAIGAVIGHEITHGFDDQGRKFDARGNLANWWTDEDEKKFTERAQCLVDQYGNFVADGETKLNGKQTLGENTADNGGIRMAMNGLRKRLGEKGMAEKIGGLTAEQRFFYGFANIWCSSERPEARRLQALTGVHSLPEFRVNGTVSNSPDFAKAFNCPAGSPMNRAEKACRVW
ncbi:M13 family metallopeptidase [Aerophototrophica crusticola]|uniref:M13 family metallopeptidase n=1 Tax=Aerophototrophica crusticola TaxID=1709002 RepID=A0A858R4I7_9PROT|nr:M13 family metallopeptidase [Rhodospirillaceae bacterium B3]